MMTFQIRYANLHLQLKGQCYLKKINTNSIFIIFNGHDVKLNRSKMGTGMHPNLVHRYNNIKNETLFLLMKAFGIFHLIPCHFD